MGESKSKGSGGAGGSNWNLPNALTVLRILLTPAIMHFLADEEGRKKILAASAVGGAALTDFLDGFIARRQDQVTRLGQFLDPLADKCYISSSFLVLAAKKRLPAWVPGVIIGREAAVTLFRLYARRRGSSVPASIWGKLKTNAQLLAIFLLIFHHPSPGYRRVEELSTVLAVALTLYSGVDYFRKAGRYLEGNSIRRTAEG